MRQFNKYPQAKLLFIALIGVSLVVLFMRTSGGVLATESGWWASLWHAIVNPAETTANALTTVFLDLITFLAKNIILPIVLPIAGVLLHFGVQKPDFLLGTTDAYDLWYDVAVVANGIYLFALVVASIAIMTGMAKGAYNLKKFLGGFIAAVALGNFSLIIVKALLGLGTTLEGVVYWVGGRTGMPIPTTIADGRIKIFDYLNALTEINVDSALWTSGTAFKEATQFIILVISCWIVLKLGFVLFERVVRLFIAAITAPIIFAASLLPNFQKSASQWWESTIKWILVLPLTLVVILLGLFFFYKAGITDYTHLQDITTKLDPEEILTALENSSTSTTGTDALQDVLYIVLGLFTLWQAGMVSSSLKLGSVLGGLVETPQKAISAGQKAWKPVADVFTGKGLIGGTLAGKTMVGQIARQSVVPAAREQYLAAAERPSAIKNFETWRASRTGAAGWLLNRAGMESQMKAVHEEKGKERTLRGSEAEKERLQTRLDAAATNAGYAKWSTVPEEVKERLYGNLATRLRPGSLRRTADSFELLKGRTKFATLGLTKETAKGEEPPASDLERDMFSQDRAVAAKAFQLMKRVARDRNNAEQQKVALAALSRVDLPERFRDEAAKIVGRSKDITIGSPDLIYEDTKRARAKYADAAVSQLLEMTKAYKTRHGGATPTGWISGPEISVMIDNRDTSQALNNSTWEGTAEVDIDYLATDPLAQTAYHDLQTFMQANPRASEQDLRSRLRHSGVVDLSTQRTMINISRKNVTQSAINIRHQFHVMSNDVHPGDPDRMTKLIGEIRQEIDKAQDEHQAAQKISRQFQKQDTDLGNELLSLADSRITSGTLTSVTNLTGTTIPVGNVDDISSINRQMYKNLDRNRTGWAPKDGLSAHPNGPALRNYLSQTFGLTPTTLDGMNMGDVLKYLRSSGRAIDEHTGSNNNWI